MDKSLYPHFIRGYFDGDGCISQSSAGNWKVGFVSGSRLFINGLEMCLAMHAGTSNRTIYKRESSKAHDLIYTKREDMAKLFNFFYDRYAIEKELLLPRKHKKFVQYMNSCL